MTVEVLERIDTPVPVVQQQSNLAVISPAYLLELAVSKGADIEQLERLMALKERFDKNEAVKAFNDAFARFKAKGVEIVKTKLITDGPLKGKKHAELAAILAAVTPALSEFGLSISWSLTKDEPAWMEVTCTLRHVGGHCEVVAMGGAPDTGPGRNAIQARGSVKTYLERYTGTAILGMAAKEQDDDGAGGKPESTDITALLVGLGATTTSAAALAYWRVNKESLKDDWAAANRFKKAVAEHRTELERGAA